MALMRRDLFRELSDIRREFNRLFDQYFGPRVTGRRGIPSPEGELWQPPIDMFEREKELVVRAELPGVAKEDIKVSATSDSLAIKGTVSEKETKEVQYYCCERVRGDFARNLSLPVTIVPEKVKATYHDGVLEVIMPKAEVVTGKEIRVEA